MLVIYSLGGRGRGRSEFKIILSESEASLNYVKFGLTVFVLNLYRVLFLKPHIIFR